jgi:cytidine deaminase
VTSEDERLPAEVLQDLLARAERVAANAYAPYSNLHIGAALLSEAGETYEGCNVENASYGLTWCAERTAVTSAIAAEGPTMRIEAVVVCTPDLEVCSPCGACRQVLAEFGPDAVVVFKSDRGELAQRTVRSLLPEAFMPGDLAAQ